jgi:hypothetical protein
MPKPNFFIVGAGKCGTTSLYAYLRQHPEVFMPDRKELHFYSTDLERSNRIKEQEYFELFEGAGDKKRIGEASADYLYSRAACNRIKETYPDAKIIIALRNPVEKVHSTHFYALWLGREEIEDFEEALARDDGNKQGKRPRRRTYVDGAKYAKYVRMYLETFGSKQVHIVLFEEMRRNPEGVFEELCRFLEISPDIRVRFNRHNASRQPRFKGLAPLLIPSSTVVQVGKRILGRRRVLGNLVRGARKWNTKSAERPPMRDETRQRLEEEFADDVAQLSDLLGRDMAAYWFSSEKRAVAPGLTS